MRILCIGGGPAGLYTALLLKRADPRHVVRVVERNRPYDTFGWGVVFSDATLDNLRAADAETADAIASAFNHWDDIDVHFKGRTITSRGHGFCGIGRRRLLNILQHRCEALGVDLVFDCNVDDETQLAREFGADLVVAADGANSRVRGRYADAFAPDVDLRRCRFVWLGTHQRFDAFTFAFEATEFGWFQAHAYQYDADTSTFIVEAPEDVWRRAGLDRMSQEDGIAFCERLFARYLGGNRLMSNAAHLRGSAIWTRFPRVVCAHWTHQLRVDGREVPIVLIGDAAHTAHFSVGSGTKLALEDAIALVRELQRHSRKSGDPQAGATPQLDSRMRGNDGEGANYCEYANDGKDLCHPRESGDPHVGATPQLDSRMCGNDGERAKDDAPSLAAALAAYESERSVEVLKIQNAARNSTEWFENVDRYSAFEAEQFAYSLLTRSQRISHENLRLRDSAFVARLESWFADAPQAVPPMFTPFTLRGLTLPNRVVVSPMAQYSCVDGVPDDYYLVHLGSRAHGGAGLVFTEMTCVAADARISPGCAGLWNDGQRDAWRRIVDYVHARTPAKIAVQLGHAGPKGSTQLGWEAADEPLAAGNWPLVAPSTVRYGPRNQAPKSMTHADMEAVKADFVRATVRAADCGFDWLELHCAHGYLLSAFLSPLTNRRQDNYGGDIAARCRYPLEVFAAMRDAWPGDRPMSVRVSAHDWAPGGNTPDDAVEIARRFKAAGADLIDVSSGQTTRDAKPVYGRMYQTPFADRIRNEVDIATMAVGAIFEPDHVNSILMAGRADLCAIGRPHLADPYWTLHAAAALGYRDMPWPPQYLAGKSQLERNLAREAASPVISRSMEALP